MAQSGSLGGSAWVEGGGHAFPASTNTLDPESMPSDNAQAARDKAKEIMAALQNGKPGDADKLMGKNENNTNALTGGSGWFKSKFGGSKKEEKEKKEKDTVIR